MSVLFVFYGVVKLRSFYIIFDRRGRWDNRNCFNGGCWFRACVCVWRHCEEYILVGFVG